MGSVHVNNVFLWGNTIKSMGGVLGKFWKIQSCMSSSTKKKSLRFWQTINVGELDAAAVLPNIW